MIAYHKANETEKQFWTREYSLCSERVEKYCVLQSLRRSQGYFGAALFYQEQAARWHIRKVEAWSNCVHYIAEPRLRILNWNVGLTDTRYSRDHGPVVRPAMTATR